MNIFSTKYCCFLILLLFSCDFDFGEEKDYSNKDPKESRLLLEYLLEKKIGDTISDIFTYKNESFIDPYYYAKFKSNNSFIESIMDTSWIKKANLDTFIDHAGPKWFDLKIDSTTVLYYKESPGTNKELYFNQKTKTAYFIGFSY